MGWKATGQPTVRRQRGKWVVRVDGIDTTTGKHRPRQIGTYESQRSAQRAAREVRADGVATERGTVSWLVRRWVEGRTDITVKAREGYAWAIPHIEEGLGAIQVARLDREDVSKWLEELAGSGKLSKRSVQICRTVLRAALADAVDEGLIPRSPAARVPLPRTVAKPAKLKQIETWDEDEVQRFLAATADHRWAIAFRLGVLYGLRRSEVLALRWDDLDLQGETLRIDEGLVAINDGIAWTEGKSERSRRKIPLDPETLALLRRRRREQNEERLVTGAAWEDHDLIVATKHGRPVVPRNYDKSLKTVIERAGLPKLTSHGLRHTAATLMVAQAKDVGEMRAIADILGHSPDMLMKTYAHAMPASTTAVISRMGTKPSSF
jgi:integrase